MKHLAIIADGNRRWAMDSGLPKELGYSQGLTTMEKCCSWAIDNKIQYLTIYCFSTENWNREKAQVDFLFELADEYFENNLSWYINQDIRINFSGRRDRLSEKFQKKINQCECETSACKKLNLILCVDYGGRDEIVRAIKSGAKTQEDISVFVNKLSPDPDVILRTGGQQRLSNFLLWQSAYSELFFIDDHFPALERKHLDFVKQNFEKRQRNFGK